MLQTKEIKFILVTTQTSIQDSKGKIFIDSLNHFAKLFNDVDKLDNKVAICFTKTDEYMEKETIFELIDDLMNSNNKLFSDEARKLIKLIKTNESIFLF